jgi:hypothetical protein
MKSTNTNLLLFAQMVHEYNKISDYKTTNQENTRNIDLTKCKRREKNDPKKIILQGILTIVFTYIIWNFIILLWLCW